MCEKHKVILQSVVFSVFKENKNTVTSSMHNMSGDFENIDAFVRDVRKDQNVISLNRKGDTFFLLEKADLKAVAFYTPKIIFIKPTLIDSDGVETWEIGSWNRAEITNFIENVKLKIKNFKLLSLRKVDLDNVYFPKLLPDLTVKQKRAIELAIEYGYYKIPRKINLRKLAEYMGVSLSTYEQHLRTAEKKLIPNILSFAQ